MTPHSSERSDDPATEANAPRVLVVEDDRATAELVALYLRAAGFQPEVEEDGLRGLDRALKGSFQLVILDRMLPGLEGLEVLRQLRSARRPETGPPVILLTARTTEDDRVRGLDLGADDYVPKPFSPRELMARVRAVLRRRDEARTREAVVACGGLEIDLHRRRVRVAGETVEVTAQEWALLATLAGAPGRIFTRAELVERAFGAGWDGLDRTVDVHIMNLRRKLERDRGRPRHLVTVRGIGYRLEPHD